MEQSTQYAGPLEGLNVIDFGHYYAGPMAAMLLADQGANVIRIVKPGARELPEQQYRLLNRNKKLLELDLKAETGKSQALSLIKRADVVIENFRPGVMKRLGLDYACVKEDNPGLIYLSMPGFASTDKKRAHIQAWEGVLNAAAGVYTQTHQTRSMLDYPPVYSAAPQCSAHGSMRGVIAVMAALNARETHGKGTLIEAPLIGRTPSVPMFGPLDGSAPKVAMPEGLKPPAFRMEDSETEQLAKLEAARQEHVALPAKPFGGGVYSCKDGRKIFLLCFDHKTFIGRLFEALGIDRELRSEGLVNEGWYTPSERGNNVSDRRTLREEYAARITQLVEKAFLTKTAEEWESILGDQLPLSVIRTRKEWLTLKPMLDSGVFAIMDNGVSELTVPGRTTNVSGPGNRFMDPFFIREPKVISLESIEQVLTSGESGKWQVDGAPLCKGDLLKGLKVLDISNVMAGPVSASSLAEYGATVIKADPAQPSSTNNHYIYLPSLIHVSMGKKSILTDAKTAPGQEVLRKLIGWADIIIHNTLDDTAKRLGVDAAQVKAINPNAIVCQMTCYGGVIPNGWESRPGYDWQAQATSGLMTRFGSEEYPFLHGWAVAADIMGGLTMAFASLLGSYQRRRTGWAGQVRMSLVNAVNYFQLPWMILEKGRCDWGDSSGQFTLGEHWWQRMYQCRDGWIYVGTTEARAEALAERINATANSNVQALETVFRERTCDEWLDELLAADFGAHRVITGDEPVDPATVRCVNNQSADEHASDTVAVLRWENHPCGQPVNLRPADNVVIGEDRSYFRQAPAPYLGQNTREILTELGYTQDEIEELIRLRVSHEFLSPLGRKNAYVFKPENQS